MNVSAQNQTTVFEDSSLYELSTKGKIATREDVVRKLFLKENILENNISDRVTQAELQNENREGIEKVLSLPQFKDVPKLVVSPYIPLQEWEGCVQIVGGDTFTASLLDMTNKRNIEDEEADFVIEDLTEDDKKLLRPGAIFRWLIGYRLIGGTKERSSRIVFRRLPAWTASDLKAARAKAKHTSCNIKWE